MKIGAMMKILEKIREKHGNIDLLVCDDDGRITSPRSTQVLISEGEYPDHWDMPEGFKFVQVNA